MKSYKHATAILTVAGLLALALPATAQEPEIVITGKMPLPEGTEPVTQVVRIADLDLTTPKGKAAMEKRVKAAIKRVCWSQARPARWQVKDAEECDAFAWAGARPQMKQAIEKAKGN